MRKLILALVLTTAVCLALAAVAAADPGSIQVSGQSATTSAAGRGRVQRDAGRPEQHQRLDPGSEPR